MSLSSADLVEGPGVARVFLVEELPEDLVTILEGLAEPPLGLGLVQPVGLLDGGAGLPPRADTLHRLGTHQAGPWGQQIRTIP